MGGSGNRMIHQRLPQKKFFCVTCFQFILFVVLSNVFINVNILNPLYPKNIFMNCYMGVTCPICTVFLLTFLYTVLIVFYIKKYYVS